MILDFFNSGYWTVWSFLSKSSHLSCSFRVLPSLAILYNIVVFLSFSLCVREMMHHLSLVTKWQNMYGAQSLWSAHENICFFLEIKWLILIALPWKSDKQKMKPMLSCNQVDTIHYTATNETLQLMKNSKLLHRLLVLET